MWTCPKCGAKLVSRNMWHACGPYTVEGFLADQTPRARELFAAFDAFVRLSGENVTAAPAKTRVAYMARVRFAGVERVGKDSLTVAFSLPEPKASPRFASVKEVVPGWWMHSIKLTTPEQLDDELLEYFREAYRLMGMQERLRGGDP